MTQLSSLRHSPWAWAWAWALLGASLGAGAQTAPVSPPPAPDASNAPAAVPGRPALPAVAPADRRFVFGALVGGKAETELGQVAQQRGGDHVRAMAQRIALEAAQAHEELLRIAGAKGVPVPAALSGAQRLAIDRLKQVAATEFDRAYVQHMLAERRKSVDEFELASRTVVDADIRDFALRTLPTLQVHLQLAQTADASVRGTAAR